MAMFGCIVWFLFNCWMIFAWIIVFLVMLGFGGFKKSDAFCLIPSFFLTVASWYFFIINLHFEVVMK